MNHAKRRALLFLTLAGVVGWSGWLALNDTPAQSSDIDLVEPVHRAPVQPTVSAQVAPPHTQTQEPPSRLALSRTNLFPSQTWFVPPPPPPPPPAPPPPPPPPPQAPALPFTYMGHWQEAGQTTYYLTRGTLPVSVQANQVLDGVWRLEPVNGSVLNFTYLPLNQTRSLRTGE